ncbi:MAG: hypothetical protein BWZ02_03392 [Lentisphaerae bacterium ADurb.BinA184]|nr:MAG: hypothetical protein BWZ02_03392 [Lentisphaerae bacterium ADurb.BinA184]
MWYDWNTNPTRRRRNAAARDGESSPYAAPSHATRPASGRSSVPRMFRNVVLPLPEAPMIASHSPRATARPASTSTSIRRRPSW